MIPYSKLNSHGNDFILVENDGTKPSLSIDQIKYYSKREVIGCDQFFIINTSNIENIVCDVFNQDGTKACLLYTSPSPRDRQKSRKPSSA